MIKDAPHSRRVQPVGPIAALRFWAACIINTSGFEFLSRHNLEEVQS